MDVLESSDIHVILCTILRRSTTCEIGDIALLRRDPRRVVYADNLCKQYAYMVHCKYVHFHLTKEWRNTRATKSYLMLPSGM